MGTTTGIEWTDKTFNAWIGCARVSPGCENCYAETDQDKRRGRAKWGVHGTRSMTSDNYWKQPIAWNKEAKEKGIRYKVFCGSLCDIFEKWDGQVQDHLKRAREIKQINEHGHLPDKWIPMTLQHLRERLFELISKTPYLDWQLLTKRPENIMQMVPESWKNGFPLNVWIGSTMEDQRRFDERIRELIAIPAIVRFISFEPALGEIKTYPFLSDESAKQVDGKPAPQLRGIQWVICGGESGPNARMINPDWIRSMRNQCLMSNVPFFFKQWGSISNADFVSVDEMFIYTNAGWDHKAKKGGSNFEGKEYKNFPDIEVNVIPNLQLGDVLEAVGINFMK